MCKGGGGDGLTDEQATTLETGTAAAQSVETALMGSPASTVETGTGTFTAGGDEIMTSSSTPATSGFIADATSAIGDTGPQLVEATGGNYVTPTVTNQTVDADGNIVDVTTGGDTVSYGGGSVMTEGSVLGNQGQLIAGQSDTDSLINSRFDNFQPTTVVQQSIDTSDLAKSAKMDAGFNAMSLGLGNLDGQGNLTNSGTLTSQIGSVNNNLVGADGTGGIMGGVNQIGTDMTNLGAAEGDVSQLGNRFNTVDTTLANMGSNELDTTGVAGRFAGIEDEQLSAKNAQNEMVTRLMGADEFDESSILGKMKSAILSGQTTIDDVVDKILKNQGANQVDNVAASNKIQLSLDNQDTAATKFSNQYTEDTNLQNSAAKDLALQMTGGFQGVGTSNMNTANSIINAGNTNASDIASGITSAAAANTTNYGQIMKDLSSVNKVVTGDQQTEVLNRLSTIKQVLSSNELDIDEGLRSQYSALANSFDEQGKLITNTANANGEVMRRGFDNANNLVLSAFNANGSLLNQQILDMNTLFSRMDSLGYNQQGDQFGDLSSNGLGLMSGGGTDTPVIQQSF